MCVCVDELNLWSEQILVQPGTAGKASCRTQLEGGGTGGTGGTGGMGEDYIKIYREESKGLLLFTSYLLLSLETTPAKTFE